MKEKIPATLFVQILLAVSQVVFPLVIYPVITHHLGAEGLGKVSFADSLVQAIVILASFGIPLYGIREIAIHKNNRRERSDVFWELFFLQLVLLVPAVILLWLIGLTSAIEYNLLVLGTVAIVGNSLSCEWFLQGSERFLFLALRSVAVRLVSTLLILLLVNDKDDYFLYYTILCGSVLATMFLNLAVIISISRWPAALVQWRVHLKNVNWLYGCYVFASLYALLDSLFLGWLSTNEAVGYYSLGYRIVRMSAMLIPTLGVVFIPRIAFHHAAANKLEVQKQIQNSLQVIFFFGIPLSVSFFILAPEIIDVFASQHFHPTVSVIRILSPVPLLVGLSHLTGSQILLPTKQEKVFFRFLAAGCLLNVALDLVLIPVLEEKGAAIANASVEGFVTAGTFWYLQKQRMLFVARKQFVYCLGASLLLLPVVYTLRFLQASPATVLILSLLITGGLYLMIHFRVFPDTIIKEIIPLRKSA